MRSRSIWPTGQGLRKSISFRLAVATALGTLLLLATAVGASAEPPIEEKRVQAEAILAEVQALDEEVGAAAERYNGANYELQRLTARLATTRAALGRARTLLVVAQRRLEDRLRQLYMADDGSALEVILGARSFDDLIDGLEYSQRIADQDAQIAEEARALRDRVTAREKQLRAARERQAAVVEQRAAEVATIQARLAERQRLLASVRDEIARLEEAERRRQAELRRQAQLELERQRREAAAALARAEEQAAAQTAAASSTESAPSPPRADTPSAPVLPPDATKAQQVVAIAMQYLGVPYKWGGASPQTGFDCSGLTMYVYAQVGVSLPHYAAAQYQLGRPVSKAELEPGDLVFFRGLGHMGMYMGGGNFIHAPRTGDVVKISSLSESYYVATWVGARRVL